MIWANLLHLSTNMWRDRVRPDDSPESLRALWYHDTLQFEEPFWNELLARMVEAGLNMVVLDVGDAVKYESHPEIAVKGAWSKAKLRRELAKLRRMGLEPIPKLNFSTCHDLWLGPYSRMVSTPAYYAVCRDVIAEVIDLFDHPRFFHLGLDEETAQHQHAFEYVVVRQFELWWHDALGFIDQVVRAGVRPWVWADRIWHHREDFLRRMPVSVLQSNWYYDMSFSRKQRYVEAFFELDTAGYDQIPTGSNWADPGNFEKLVPFCRRHISPERLFGFMQSAWKPTTEEWRAVHLDAIDRIARARAAYERKSR
jgi:hypothetical protein